MRIAAAYENGQIFQHFGKTETFKVYEVVEGQVLATQMIAAEGSGHSALAGLLAEQDIDVVICGGIGGGAQSALAEAGIEVCAGAEGEADAAVAAYLAGQLTDAGVTCDHHEGGCHCGEECDCGDDGCEGGCGGCGGGCGGCGGRPMLEGKNAGKVCRVHYRGTFNDGKQFDASYDRGEPLEFVCGVGQMIPGFDAAVVNMNVGDVIDIHLMPEQAYGPSNPNAIFTVPIAQLPGSEELTVGQQVFLANAYGQPFPVLVTAKDDVNITLDANHEMAGKELNFHIELVEVKEN